MFNIDLYFMGVVCCSMKYVSLGTQELSFKMNQEIKIPLVQSLRLLHVTRFNKLLHNSTNFT